MDYLKAERHQKIVEVIQAAGRATVSELSEQFGVSDVTIRRDLADLADLGVLRRAHGGAIARVQAAPQPPVVQRTAELQARKASIARAAAGLISDGESVFLGSGSTTAHVARELAGRAGLTIVTNALNVALEFAASPDVTVVVTGGMLRESELSLIGHITEQSLREVRVDKVLIGMRAISVQHGMTNDYLAEVVTDRAIIGMADTLIVVADHTKFGQTASAFVAPVQRIRILVTDDGVEPDLVRQIEALGVRVIIGKT
jgi:DeoR/GlpR family transcriptional regulator of sugar metabolism